MNLVFRPALLEDFESVFQTCFGDNTDNLEFREIVEREWMIFGSNSAALSMIVEDASRKEGDRVVGLAQTVFVTDAFVRFLRSGGIPPHICQHATNHLPDGTFPLLEIDQVRKQQAGEGLNALTTHFSWRQAGLTAEEQWTIRAFIDRTYPLFYQGYNLKSTYFASYSDDACASLLRAGYKLLDDYEWYFQRTGLTTSSESHPYFLGFEREDAIHAEGQPVSRLFAYQPPIFGFRPHEQEVLWLAILGVPDERMAEILCVSFSTIKARWKKCFERIEDSNPALLPSGVGSGRGPEKRGELLRYLRDHLEEIRPVSGPTVRIS